MRIPEPPMSDLSFERDILSLFRAQDIDAMSSAVDLSSSEDVCKNAEEIHSRLGRRHDALRWTLVRGGRRAGPSLDRRRHGGLRAVATPASCTTPSG
jgi:hypothetical protein